MQQMKDYLTTRDIADQVGVSLQTVRNWIKAGWLAAETTIPESAPAKRSVGRYHIDLGSVATLDSEMHTILPALRKYVPREKARLQGRQRAENQPTLPGMD